MVIIGMLMIALVTVLLVEVLKAQFPAWRRFAWAPPVIGGCLGLVGAPLLGIALTAPEALNWVAIGLGAGALANSARDVVLGK